MGISRREFLARVGQAGGFSATFVAMQGLGLMPARALPAPRLDLAPDLGIGTKVAILGGGIAGLVAAYEMKALGFDCTVLEARHRPGGRSWTVRTGDSVVFTDGSLQNCNWQPGNYQNFGPARLPSIHTTILGYCRKLGVQMEVEVNSSRSTLLQNDAVNGGRPMVQRQVVNDTRGHVSELLSKCIAQGALNDDLSAEDRDRMLSFLRTYGPLDKAGRYTGSDRSGYSRRPGAGNELGTLNQPIDMHTLLDENFWGAIMFEEMFDMQATMFQPVGGMDRIAYALAKSLGPTVRYSAEVKEIRKAASGVRIVYSEGGVQKVLEADYCLCGMPLSILKKTPNDFSGPVKQVIEQCSYARAYKIAWESRRFWEQDYNIYGGLEFVKNGPDPVWLPSGGMFSERGVLVSGYGFDTHSDFDKLPLAGKLDASRGTVERLHPGHGKELEKPVYVNWGLVPFNEGSWISSYEPGTNSHTDEGSPAYETLIAADGPIYFIGDHASHVLGWQEGAALSSLRAIQMIGERERVKRS
ncbi:MAG TPA: FAD-dependent oxidoreductase [Terracidiphilus sp.]|nr:FAD-dependent oxidoreductase [Terracidiphilus sp.]